MATTLAKWLQHRLEESQLTHHAVAVYAGIAPATISGSADDHDPLVAQLLRHFRRLPDPWKPEIVRNVAMFDQLANTPVKPVVRVQQERANETPDTP